MLKILTALTFAFGGANDVTLEKTESDVSENSIFPPILKEMYLSSEYWNRVLS